jgi:hypothetical protein
VSAWPSNGRITSALTFWLISVSTWLICWLTSLLPSTAFSVTSSYCSACALAFVVMAAIQPWSAAGAEKPIVTSLPGCGVVAGAGVDVRRRCVVVLRSLRCRR